MNLLQLVLGISIILSCSKSKDIQPDKLCCDLNNKNEICDTVPYKYELVWKNSFHPFPGRSTSTVPFLVNDILITSYLAQDGDYSIIHAYNAQTGHFIWEWEDFIFGKEFLHDNFTKVISNENLLLSFKNSIYALDPGNGQSIWGQVKTPDSILTNPCISLINDYIYFGGRSTDDTEFRTSLYRRSVSNPHVLEEIFRHEDTTEVKLRFSLPTLFIDQSFDSILIFIGPGFHRTLQNKDKTGYYAYNLTKREFVWAKEYIPGGGLHAPPLVINNKVYVIPLPNIIACLDANTGDLLWEYNISEPGQFYPGDMIFEEGVLLAVNNRGYIFALDPETGAIFWKNQISEWGSGPVKMEAHKGILYIPSGSLGCQLSAWDVHTGENYWCEYSVNAICKPDCFISSSGLTIDKERGLLYTTDGYDILCIKTIR